MQKILILVALVWFLPWAAHAQNTILEAESAPGKLNIAEKKAVVVTEEAALEVKYSFSSPQGNIKKGSNAKLTLSIKNVSSVMAQNVELKLQLPTNIYGPDYKNIGNVAANSQNSSEWEFFLSAQMAGNQASFVLSIKGANVPEKKYTLTLQLDIDIIKSHAFILTTSQYTDHATWGQLPNAKAAGEKLKQILENDYLFDKVVHKNNLSLNDFMEQLKQMKQVDENDQLLIYIAGHGYYDRDFGTGHLVFNNSEGLNTQTMFSHAQLSQMIDYFPSKHILIIIDACYSSTFDLEVAKAMLAGELRGKGTKTMEQYVVDELKLISRLYLTSGETQTATGSSTQLYSPFSSALIESLLSPDYKADEVVTYLELRNDLDKRKIKPTPRGGGFGRNETRSNFLFLVK